MTWKREKGYSKYRERIGCSIRWLEWDNRQKDKRIKELEDETRKMPLLS